MASARRAVMLVMRHGAEDGTARQRNASMVQEVSDERRGDPMVFETLHVRRAGAVLFVQIAAPPMNLNGPELVRDLVSLIQRAEADDTIRVLVFTSGDPDYFISHVDITRVKENRAEAAKLAGDP